MLAVRLPVTRVKRETRVEGIIARSPLLVLLQFTGEGGGLQSTEVLLFLSTFCNTHLAYALGSNRGISEVWRRKEE